MEEREERAPVEDNARALCRPRDRAEDRGRDHEGRHCPHPRAYLGNEDRHREQSPAAPFFCLQLGHGPGPQEGGESGDLEGQPRVLLRAQGEGPQAGAPRRPDARGAAGGSQVLPGAPQLRKRNPALCDCDGLQGERGPAPHLGPNPRNHLGCPGRESEDRGRGQEGAPFPARPRGALNGAGRWDRVPGARRRPARGRHAAAETHDDPRSEDHGPRHTLDLQGLGSTERHTRCSCGEVPIPHMGVGSHASLLPHRPVR